jgi:preprotein translocase subunit SecG
MFNFFKTKNSVLTKSIWIMLLVFFFSNLAFSFQNSSPREDYLQSEFVEKKLSESAWSNAKSGLDYSKHKTNKKKKSTDPNEPVDDGDYSDAVEEDESAIPVVSDFWSGFFKFLFIAMAVIILAFIIANMVGAEGWALAPSNKKIKPQAAIPITLENIEERIHESDLDRYIREALEKENYPMAVRLYYLAIIKELSLKKWIKWKKDKTNRDYIRELSTTDWYPNFRSVTAMFEKVWYGKKELGGMDFRSSVQPIFQSLLKATQQAKKKV